MTTNKKEISSSNGKYQVKEYKNDTSFYGFWLADNTQIEVDKKYVIKRNNQYKVYINNVSGPGDASEDDVINKDPEEDVEESTKNSIYIVPYPERQTTETIGSIRCGVSNYRQRMDLGRYGAGRVHVSRRVL